MSLFAVTVSRAVTNGAAVAADIYALRMNPNDDKSRAYLYPPRARRALVF